MVPPRTNATKVRKIAEQARQLSNADVDGYIEVASTAVDEFCLGVGYSDARLEMIERYLAAHFMYIDLRRPMDEQVGASRNRYETELGRGLALTEHGQQVQFWDDQRTLSPVIVKFEWLGKADPP